MKLRSDFVTNSSSSSFVTICVSIDGQEKEDQFEGPGYEIVTELEEHVNDLQELKDFLYEKLGYCDEEDAEDLNPLFGDVESVEELDSIYLQWEEGYYGEFYNVEAPQIINHKLNGEDIPVVDEDDPDLDDLICDWEEKLEESVFVCGRTIKEWQDMGFEVDPHDEMDGIAYDDDVREALVSGDWSAIIDNYDPGDSTALQVSKFIKFKDE